MRKIDKEKAKDCKHMWTPHPYNHKYERCRLCSKYRKIRYNE
jgi:hypothetical protein